MKPAGRPAAAITPEQVHAYQARGMTQAQAAAILGVSLSTVRKHWQTQTPGRQSPYADQIAAMLAEGKTDKEIAQATGASVPTVSRHRRKAQGEREPGTPNAPGAGRPRKQD